MVDRRCRALGLREYGKREGEGRGGQGGRVLCLTGIGIDRERRDGACSRGMLEHVKGC